MRRPGPLWQRSTVTVLTSFQLSLCWLVCGLRWYSSMQSILSLFFSLFFLADISFFSPCSFALRHWWGPVKLLVGWDWNSNQICKPICQRQYEPKVNFDKRKKVYSHFPHTSETAMPSHGCTSTHPPSALNIERKWKHASFTASKVKGERDQGEISHFWWSQYRI